MSTLADLAIALTFEPEMHPAGRVVLIAVAQNNDGGIVTRPLDRDLVQRVVGISDEWADEGIEILRADGIVFTDEYGTWATCFPTWEMQWLDAVRTAHPTTRQPVPLALRMQIYARDEYACVECGESEPLSIDHINPVSRGGLTVHYNLQTLCLPCNIAKGDRMPA